MKNLGSLKGPYSVTYFGHLIDGLNLHESICLSVYKDFGQFNWNNQNHWTKNRFTSIFCFILFPIYSCISMFLVVSRLYDTRQRHTSAGVPSLGKISVYVPQRDLSRACATRFTAH